MKKLDVAAGAGFGGTVAVAISAMTSGEAKGWLDVIDGALNRPGAVLVLLLLAGLCLIWLLVRGVAQHRDCEAKIDRLEQLLLYVLRDHEHYDLIVRNWGKIKDGELLLDDILRGEMPERRRSKRRRVDAPNAA